MSTQPPERPVDLADLPPDLFADVPPGITRGWSADPSDAGHDA